MAQRIVGQRPNGTGAVSSRDTGADTGNRIHRHREICWCARRHVTCREHRGQAQDPAPVGGERHRHQTRTELDDEGHLLSRRGFGGEGEDHAPGFDVEHDDGTSGTQIVEHLR
nr:hypothetical protein [Gordonia alkanivorans]